MLIEEINFLESETRGKIRNSELHWGVQELFGCYFSAWFADAGKFGSKSDVRSDDNSGVVDGWVFGGSFDCGLV